MERRAEEPEREMQPDEPVDPTTDADEAEPTTPGPGDSEGSRPEPDPEPDPDGEPPTRPEAPEGG